MSDGEEGAAARGGVAPPSGERLFVVAARELRTLVRTPAVVAVAAAFFLVVLGIATVGGGSAGGYVPLTLDLLTVVEVLVPVVAFAVGYRAVVEDRTTGELDVLRTYDLSRATYVGGVFLGRGLGLFLVVFVTLSVAGVTVPLSGGTKASFLATNAAADSPWLFGRFLVLTLVFALVALAVSLAASALARSTREAFALVVALLLVLVAGFDTGIVAAMASGTGGAGLDVLVALSPNSAYRALVLDVAVGAAGTETARTGSALLNLLGLAAWFVGGLGLAAALVWRE